MQGEREGSRPKNGCTGVGRGGVGFNIHDARDLEQCLRIQILLWNGCTQIIRGWRIKKRNIDWGNERENFEMLWWMVERFEKNIWNFSDIMGARRLCKRVLGGCFYDYLRFLRNIWEIFERYWGQWGDARESFEWVLWGRGSGAPSLLQPPTSLISHQRKNNSKYYL